MCYNLVNFRVFRYSIILIYLVIAHSCTVFTMSNVDQQLGASMIEETNIPLLNSDQPVKKKVLKNGLTVLVHESHIIPKVSIQMWYNVGSKDELLSEKGIAHLIEHMIFKGTDTLSESDINTLVHKLSGSCNAFTSNDYTGYLFNFPTQNWKEALPVIA